MEAAYLIVVEFAFCRIESYFTRGMHLKWFYNRKNIEKYFTKGMHCKSIYHRKKTLKNILPEDCLTDYFTIEKYWKISYWGNKLQIILL